MFVNLHLLINMHMYWLKWLDSVLLVDITTSIQIYKCIQTLTKTLMNSLHRQLKCEIGGLDCHVITTEYKTSVHCIHMYNLFCNALIHVIYSGVSGQCFHTILQLSLEHVYHCIYSHVQTEGLQSLY